MTTPGRLLFQTFVLRFGIGLAACGVFFAFWLLRAQDAAAYTFFTSLPDGVRKLTPFVDLRAILQAGSCFREGVDVYRHSACLFGGTFNYSPFLLGAGWLPIGPRDATLGGCLLALGFFASFCLLPKPVTMAEFLLRLAATLSPAIFYGVEQGNFDLAIFITSLGGILLLRFGLGFRLAGYWLFVLGAACKFYPAALLVLTLREPRRIFALLALAGIVTGLLFLQFYGEGAASAIATIPSGTPFRATFGAIDLPRGLLLLNPIAALRNLAAAIAFLLSLPALVVSYVCRRRYSATLQELAPATRTFLIAGAAVCTLCFYTAQNVCYREIFLLFALPGLAALGRGRMPLLPAAILILLWEAAIRAMLTSYGALILFWMLRQVLWWWVIVELGAILAAFLELEISNLLYEDKRLRPLPAPPLA